MANKTKVSDKSEKAIVENKATVEPVIEKKESVDVSTWPSEVKVEVIKDSKHLKKGDVYTIGKETAKRFIELGVAKKLN